MKNQKKLAIRRARRIRKWSKPLLIGAMLLALSAPIWGHAQTETEFNAYITMQDPNSRVNFRTEPSLNSKSIDKLKYETPVKVIDKEGDWYKIEYGRKQGYVYCSYIIIKQTSEESTIEDFDFSSSSMIKIGEAIISSKYDQNRNHNLDLAAKTISVTLEKGEQFIWSKIVGPASKEQGYLPAKVISNGKYVNGDGGGVCQVSTTLYNALLQTEIVPDEVHSHSLGCSYAQKDATVAYGQKDFKFTNKYDYPMVIKASAEGATVTVELFLQK